MRFARWTFRLAAIYGLILLAPLYVLERAIGVATIPITHPEYYYGFVGCALAAQHLFLLISSNPVRYRPAMVIAIFGKISFAIPAWLLWFAARVTPAVVSLATVDLLLAGLFAISFLKTSPSGSGALKALAA